MIIMYRRFVIFTFLLISFLSIAQGKYYSDDNNFGFGTGYLAKDALAELVQILLHEADTYQHFDDEYFYRQGRIIWADNLELTSIAASDAFWSIEALSSFSDAVGMELSEDKTPALWKLISEAAQDTENLVALVKSRRYRTRPYVAMKEPPDSIADREILAGTSSTPLGHSVLAATIVGILIEIYPDCAPEIIQRGNEFTDNRWILGFHYKSDTELGKKIGGYVVSILHSNKQFNRQLHKAKCEARRNIRTI